MRNDSEGHYYEKDGNYIPPHINDEAGRHYFYKKQGRIGDSSTRKHKENNEPYDKNKNY